MDGPSGSSSGMMNFGDQNNNGLCSMMMMMPLMSSHQHQNHHDGDACSSFLPLPPPPNYNNNNNNNTSNPICYFMDENNNNNNEGNNANSSSSSSSEVKAKIMAHPHYHRLLAAYVNCRKVTTRKRKKRNDFWSDHRFRSEALFFGVGFFTFWQVGAPPEVVARLEEACASAASMNGTSCTGCIGEDPALDQFMEAYCEMLTKYEQELSKPFRDAMLFLQRIECQFKALSISSSDAGEFLTCFYFFFFLKPSFMHVFSLCFLSCT